VCPHGKASRGLLSPLVLCDQPFEVPPCVAAPALLDATPSYLMMIVRDIVCGQVNLSFLSSQGLAIV
jgi:hypothetical protein